MTYYRLDLRTHSNFLGALWCACWGAPLHEVRQLHCNHCVFDYSEIPLHIFLSLQCDIAWNITWKFFFILSLSFWELQCIWQLQKWQTVSLLTWWCKCCVSHCSYNLWFLMYFSGPGDCYACNECKLGYTDKYLYFLHRKVKHGDFIDLTSYKPIKKDMTGTIKGEIAWLVMHVCIMDENIPP